MKRSLAALLLALPFVVALVPAVADSTGLVGEPGVPDPTPPNPPKAFDLPDTPIVAGAAVGYVPSSWAVGSGGQLSYSLPLDVPRAVRVCSRRWCWLIPVREAMARRGWAGL